MPKILNLATKEIAEELRSRYGGMMTCQDIMREIGAKHHTAGERWVADIPYTIVNGRKKWRVSEVARKIYNNTVQPL